MNSLIGPIQTQETIRPESHSGSSSNRRLFSPLTVGLTAGAILTAVSTVIPSLSEGERPNLGDKMQVVDFTPSPLNADVIVTSPLDVAPEPIISGALADGMTRGEGAETPPEPGIMIFPDLPNRIETFKKSGEQIGVMWLLNADKEVLIDNIGITVNTETERNAEQLNRGAILEFRDHSLTKSANGYEKGSVENTAAIGQDSGTANIVVHRTDESLDANGNPVKGPGRRLGEAGPGSELVVLVNGHYLTYKFVDIKDLGVKDPATDKHDPDIWISQVRKQTEQPSIRVIACGTIKTPGAGTDHRTLGYFVLDPVASGVDLSGLAEK